VLEVVVRWGVTRFVNISPKTSRLLLPGGVCCRLQMVNWHHGDNMVSPPNG